MDLNNGEKLSDNQKIKINHKNKNIAITKLNYIDKKIEYIRVIKATNFDYFSEKAQKRFF